MIDFHVIIGYLTIFGKIFGEMFCSANGVVTDAQSRSWKTGSASSIRKSWWLETHPLGIADVFEAETVNAAPTRTAKGEFWHAALTFYGTIVFQAVGGGGAGFAEFPFIRVRYWCRMGRVQTGANCARVV